MKKKYALCRLLTLLPSLIKKKIVRSFFMRTFDPVTSSVKNTVMMFLTSVSLSYLCSSRCSLKSLGNCPHEQPSDISAFYLASSTTQICFFGFLLFRLAL